MPRLIHQPDCIACGTCQRVCFVGCISKEADGKRHIDATGCLDCGACQLACPKQCISLNRD